MSNSSCLPGVFCARAAQDLHFYVCLTLVAELWPGAAPPADQNHSRLSYFCAPWAPKVTVWLRFLTQKCCQTEGFNGSCAQNCVFHGSSSPGASLWPGTGPLPSRSERPEFIDRAVQIILRWPVPAVLGTTLAALLCLKEQTRQEETRPEGTRQDETIP